MNEEPWYKNAVIYAVDVSRFNDADGDGWGDFTGLTNKLGYLADLGVTCLWLLPFYPTPGRDNGYDVSDYFRVDPRLGTFDDFLAFLEAAGEHSLRVIVDLVVDHTSNEHPWFQAARRSPDSRFHDYYVWTDHPPPVPPGRGSMFPGQEPTVWTFDEVAGQYYYHRFYHFEPELNTANPAVQEEIKQVLDFWLSFGISGFRVDAANHLIQMRGLPSTKPDDPLGLLGEMRSVATSHDPEALLLGEADEPPEELSLFFGKEGDAFNMLFNFALNGYIFLAFARGEIEPVVQALRQLPDPPASAQWANFLRNLDELDLERLTDSERQEVMDAFAPEDGMRIFGRGIRRRLAPMMEGDRQRMECAFSLLFSLPGAPMIVYGDEIGMGDDLSQEGRDAVRAPMQWANEQQAGFSSAPTQDLLQPPIRSGPFSYEKENVATQQEEAGSFLNWMKRLIHMRRQCPEIGCGTWHLFDVESSSVMAHRCVWQDGIVIAIHNLSTDEQEVTIDLRDQQGRKLESLLEEGKDASHIEGRRRITLKPYGYKWYRVAGEPV